MLNNKRSVGLIVVIVVLISIAGIVWVSAQDDDGRINPDALLGGSAIYCVDPAAGANASGGILVLDASGNELLFVTARHIDAVGVPAVNTVLGKASGSYGPMQLYRLTSGEFALFGYEEPGKPFHFVWAGCASTSAGQADAPPAATADQQPTGAAGATSTATPTIGYPPPPTLAPTPTNHLQPTPTWTPPFGGGGSS